MFLPEPLHPFVLAMSPAGRSRAPPRRRPRLLRDRGQARPPRRRRAQPWRQARLWTLARRAVRQPTLFRRAGGYDLALPAKLLTDENSNGVTFSSAWAYQLGAGQGNQSNAFSSYIYASAGGNSVPSAYNVEDFQWLGGFDQSDSVFVQIGYGTNQLGQEFLFAWSTDPAGTTCEPSVSSHYLGTTYFGQQYCVAPFSNLGVTDNSWIYFWIWENNAQDQLYINGSSGSTLFAYRTAASAANFNGVLLVTAEVSAGTNYDMQNDLIAHGLGLYGYYDQFSGWNGSGWVYQTPLYTDNAQFGYPGYSPNVPGNYFGQSPCSPPGGPFGQAEPYGAGSGGYDAGDSSSQCVSNRAQVPGS